MQCYCFSANTLDCHVFNLLKLSSISLEQQIQKLNRIVIFVQRKWLEIVRNEVVYMLSANQWYLGYFAFRIDYEIGEKYKISSKTRSGASILNQKCKNCTVSTDIAIGNIFIGMYVYACMCMCVFVHIFMHFWSQVLSDYHQNQYLH